MTRPYSVDLRERVLSAARRGDTIRGVAAQFDVSPSFVSKLETRFRRTGSVAPAPQGGDRLSFLRTPSGTGSRPVGEFGTTAEEEIDGQ